MRQRLSFAILVFLGLALPAAAQTARRPLSLDDLAKVRSVRDPQRSPDGKWVAYVVGTLDAEKDKRDSDIWMVSWDGAEQVRLTSSPESESTPRWSPDGRYLAFVASRGDEDEKKKGAQVWLLNRAGGEAQKLTDVKGGVSEFEWSPDSKRLVLSCDDPDPNDEPEKKEGWKRKTEPPIVLDRYKFKQDREGYVGPEHTHLYLFEVEGRKLDILTSGAYDEEHPAWSPDGTRIAFVSARGDDPDRTTDKTIFVIDAKPGATAREVVTYSGPDGGDVKWSPDGASLAYLQGDEQKYYAYNTNKLAVVPAAGGRRASSRRRSIARRRASSGRSTARACSSCTRTIAPRWSRACRPPAARSRSSAPAAAWSRTSPRARTAVSPSSAARRRSPPR